jgi:Cellulase (glycosyl hydrolase family 5)
MSTLSDREAARSFLSRHRTVIAVLVVAIAVAASFSYAFFVHKPAVQSPGPGIVGWGGVALNEVDRTAPGNPPSKVNPGQTASDFEYLLQVMSLRGLNAVRISWDPSCSTPTDPIGAVYNSTQASIAISIASYYKFWAILDNHGYDDPFSAPSCWLNFWSGVTSQFKDSYSQIIWEPENEPCYSGTGCNPGYTNTLCTDGPTCVRYLSAEYQDFIEQTRAQGDNHSIVVESVCSFGCGFCESGAGECPQAVESYPNVTDPVSKVYLSMHSYMDYQYYSNEWNFTTAETVANGFYQTVVAATKLYGWPALNTEGGADPLCSSVCPPDMVLNGSAGYSKTTLHFIQTLTSLYDSNSPQRINWLWWPAGDWTDTTESPLGTLDCGSPDQGWGCLLNSAPVSST